MSKIKIVENRDILPGVLARVAASVLRRSHLARYHLVRGAWQLMKEVAAPHVESLSLDRIVTGGLDDVRVDVDAVSHDRAILLALSKRLLPATFFEIGTFLGYTTYAVARNNPQAQVYTLDLPDADSRTGAELEMTDEYLFKQWKRGSVFEGTPEAARIQRLAGDSATFDFTPFLGKMDMVFVDASHSYSYVKNDTEAALRLLSPTGTILWHDYPTYPGIYAYLNELAAGQHLRIVHPLHSGLAVYSRHPDFYQPAASAQGQHRG